MKDRINGVELVNGMNPYQLSRWLALFEAVNTIADKAKSSGKKFDKINIHQPALEEYVNSTCPSIQKSLEIEQKEVDRRAAELAKGI